MDAEQADTLLSHLWDIHKDLETANRLDTIKLLMKRDYQHKETNTALLKIAIGLGLVE